MILLTWNGVNICSNHRGGTSVMYHSKLCYISYVYHSKLWYISYVPQFKPLIWGVKILRMVLADNLSIFIWVFGMVEWNAGMEHWSETLEWNTGISDPLPSI